jgi:hypothetical protein
MKVPSSTPLKLPTSPRDHFEGTAWSGLVHQTTSREGKSLGVASIVHGSTCHFHELSTSVHEQGSRLVSTKNWCELDGEYRTASENFEVRVRSARKECSLSSSSDVLYRRPTLNVLYRCIQVLIGTTDFWLTVHSPVQPSEDHIASRT